LGKKKKNHKKGLAEVAKAIRASLHSKLEAPTSNPIGGRKKKRLRPVQAT
jgi:hypothetical protein